MEGLRYAIMATILRLMPKTCKDCKGQPYYMIPGQEPDVSCVRCKIMACPNCVPKDIITHKNVKYICDQCENIVSNDVGLEAIDVKYMKKNKVSNQQGATLEEVLDDSQVDDNTEEENDDIEESNNLKKMRKTLQQH